MARPRRSEFATQPTHVGELARRRNCLYDLGLRLRSERDRQTAKVPVGWRTRPGKRFARLSGLTLSGFFVLSDSEKKSTVERHQFLALLTQRPQTFAFNDVPYSHAHTKASPLACQSKFAVRRECVT